MSTDPDLRMGSTRPRDLLAVALFGTIAGYLLIRLNYGQIPPLPRFAGLPAAVVALAEALFGRGIRSRIQADRSELGVQAKLPVPPLVAARALIAAKATALAAAAFSGLWLGLILYVAPQSAVVRAAGSDLSTGLIGLLAAAAMVSGALYLEYCCRAPKRPPAQRVRQAGPGT